MDFSEYSLYEIGLSCRLVRFIMHRVSSNSMQIFWNGSLTEEFKPSRGICQGEPLLPYLFVFGIETWA